MVDPALQDIPMPGAGSPQPIMFRRRWPVPKWPMVANANSNGFPRTILQGNSDVASGESVHVADETQGDVHLIGVRPLGPGTPLHNPISRSLIDWGSGMAVNRRIENDSKPGHTRRTQDKVRRLEMRRDRAWAAASSNQWAAVEQFSTTPSPRENITPRLFAPRHSLARQRRHTSARRFRNPWLGDRPGPTGIQTAPRRDIGARPPNMPRWRGRH